MGYENNYFLVKKGAWVKKIGKKLNLVWFLQKRHQIRLNISVCKRKLGISSGAIIKFVG